MTSGLPSERESEAAAVSPINHRMASLFKICIHIHHRLPTTSLESLVGLLGLHLLLDLDSGDGNESQSNQNEHKNNTSWKHCRKVL